MKFKIRKLKFLFNKNFGWLFINGRKQDFWCELLKKEDLEIKRIEEEKKNHKNI
jgi:hypothetical protein